MKRAAALALCLSALSCSNPSTTVTVFAASSLTGAFEQIATAFERSHPGADVRLSFDGSTALARQIRDGAPADVLAAADRESVTAVEDLADGDASIFARNRLAIAVASGNPRRITGPADLARPGLIVVVCAGEVPCGRRTDDMLANAGVTIRPASREPSVRAALSKVAAGEADAAIVYRTDVADAGPTVQGVAIPDSVNVTSDYPAVALRRAPAAARAFVAYLLGDDAQRILRRHGFEAA